MKLVLVAACALIDTDGRVLIAQRPAGKPMAGLWEFPGGKVEAGERPEETLIRELKEELGIVVNEACLAPLTFASHTYPDFHLLMPLYVCRRWEGTVTALEGQSARLGAPEPVAGLSDAARRRAADLPPDVAVVNARKAERHMTRTSGAKLGHHGAPARRFVADERGATAIEYALIAAGISVVIAATVFSVGSELKVNYYDKLAALFP